MGDSLNHLVSKNSEIGKRMHLLSFIFHCSMNRPARKPDMCFITFHEISEQAVPPFKDQISRRLGLFVEHWLPFYVQTFNGGCMGPASTKYEISWVYLEDQGMTLEGITITMIHSIANQAGSFLRDAIDFSTKKVH